MQIDLSRTPQMPFLVSISDIAPGNPRRVTCGRRGLFRPGVRGKRGDSQMAKGPRRIQARRWRVKEGGGIAGPTARDDVDKAAALCPVRSRVSCALTPPLPSRGVRHPAATLFILNYGVNTAAYSNAGATLCPAIRR